MIPQLQVAQLTLHEIMFDLPVREQLAYIAHSRVVRQEKKLRLTKVRVQIPTRDTHCNLSNPFFILAFFPAPLPPHTHSYSCHIGYKSISILYSSI